MHQILLTALVEQRTAELRKTATEARLSAAARRMTALPEQRQSLRVRTGWTLVDLGLRLVAQPGPGLAGSPRPADS